MWSARSPTAGARSCSYARASATSPPANGARAATWTCPGSVTPCSQRTETAPDDGPDHICARLRAQPVSFVTHQILSREGHYCMPLILIQHQNNSSQRILIAYMAILKKLFRQTKLKIVVHIFQFSNFSGAVSNIRTCSRPLS